MHATLRVNSIDQLGYICIRTIFKAPKLIVHGLTQNYTCGKLSKSRPKTHTALNK